jgi:hypothetical protein
MLLNTCPAVVSCIRLYPSISDQIRPTFFSTSSPNRFWRTVQPACPPKRFWQRRVRLVLPVRPVRSNPTQSDLVQPNPTTPPPLGKEIGKETVKFLAIFDHLLPLLRLPKGEGRDEGEQIMQTCRRSEIDGPDPLVPLVHDRICADIVTIRNFRLLNKRAGRRSK